MLQPRGTPNRTIRPKKRTFRLWLLLVLLVAVSFILYERLIPNREHLDPHQAFHGQKKPLFIQGKLAGKVSAIGHDESLKLPASTIQNQLDSSILYEKTSDSVIMTTENKVVRLKTNQLSAMFNEKPVALKFPAEKQQDEVFIPIAPLKAIYGIAVLETKSGAVLIRQPGETLQWAKAEGDKGETQPLRQEPSQRSPIFVDVKAGDPLIIWEESKNGWYRAQTVEGFIGYMKEADVRLDRVEVVPKLQESTPYIPWKPLGGLLNVTWEHVVSRNPDINDIGAMKGLNVVSPTWFSIADAKGNINNLADAAYVKWAHQRGLQVWALFSNGFNPDWTAQVLATYDYRMKLIKQLLAFAQTYKLQGFNIDFENVYLKDRDHLTQFVREMTPLLHEQGLVVTMDVTTHSTSEMWSLFYDRPQLAQIVDYMMLMAYDEHWAGSDIAGSVSSLPWTEKGITDILNIDKVPPDKLVLGVPYYTRLWTEKTVKGKKEVTSKALSMETAQTIIREKKLTPKFLPEVGQNYVEYEEKGVVNKIWLEDEVSMKARAVLVKKYHLAGIASWRRGFEAENIWPAISTVFGKIPE